MTAYAQVASTDYRTWSMLGRKSQSGCNSVKTAGLWL